MEAKETGGEALATARAQAAKWADEVVERRTALETSQAEWDAAKTDEAAAPVRKAEARAALGFT